MRAAQRRHRHADMTPPKVPFVVLTPASRPSFPLETSPCARPLYQWPLCSAWRSWADQARRRTRQPLSPRSPRSCSALRRVCGAQARPREREAGTSSRGQRAARCGAAACRRTFMPLPSLLLASAGPSGSFRHSVPLCSHFDPRQAQHNWRWLLAGGVKRQPSGQPLAAASGLWPACSSSSSPWSLLILLLCPSSTCRPRCSRRRTQSSRRSPLPSRTVCCFCRRRQTSTRRGEARHTRARRASSACCERVQQPCVAAPRAPLQAHQNDGDDARGGAARGQPPGHG